MTKVALLMRSKPGTGKSGLYRYAELIKETVGGKDIEIIPIEMEMDFKRGYISGMVNGVIRPFIKVMKIRKEVDLFHAADELCSIYFPFLRGRRIVTVHHVETKKGYKSKFSSYMDLISKMGLFWADEIIAISNQTKDELKRVYKVGDSRIITIPNAISDSFRTLEIPKKKYIGCVSALIPRKNVSALLRIFKKFIEMPGTEEYVLRICGDGSEHPKLLKEAQDLGIVERTEFIKGMEEEDLATFYNEAMVIANPSVYEGFGCVTLEAQRCSVPVVVFGTADIPEETIRFAIKADDENDFQQKLYDLITDDDLYRKTVEEGRTYAENYSRDFGEVMKEIYTKQ